LRKSTSFSFFILQKKKISNISPEFCKSQNAATHPVT